MYNQYKNFVQMSAIILLQIVYKNAIFIILPLYMKCSIFPRLNILTFMSVG